MNNLEKLEAVKEYYYIMKDAEEWFEECRSKAERNTMAIQEIPRKGTTENWRETAMIQMIEARDAYADAISGYAKVLKEAHDILDKIDDSQIYGVLHHRYILFKTWKQVAENMGCSYRNCMVLHKKAVRIL